MQRTSHAPRLWSRRAWLKLAALAAAPGAWGCALSAQPKVDPALRGRDPFRLGVASGPSGADGVVLWTRVAYDIEQSIADFSGLDTSTYVAARNAQAARDARYEVRWELAEDEGLRNVVRRGTAWALPELAHAVHVELEGLAPGRWYWYRFRLGEAESPIGRTRVIGAGATHGAAQKEQVNRPALRFALASCQHYEYGRFGAYAAMRADDPDAVLFVGDYIYEGGPSTRRFRAHPFPSARTLFDYRLRHALYKLDPDLQRMHAHCPWLVTWDDHEVANDYAGDFGEDARSDGSARRHAAYQAYYEHMPLPAATLVQRYSALRLYRAVQFGELATIALLDDRQYRDLQACRESGSPAVLDDAACPQRRAVARTLLGRAQMSWLTQQFQASRSRWNLIAQQTLFAPLDRDGSGGPRRYWRDGWDGYPAERARVVDAIAAARLRNPVFLGGDVHANWVTDIRRNVEDDAAPVIATEFCGTSITSASSWNAERTERAARANPHVRFADSTRRGYLLGNLTAESLRIDLRVVDDVTQERPNVSTLARFMVADGTAGAEKV